MEESDLFLLGAAGLFLTVCVGGVFTGFFGGLLILLAAFLIYQSTHYIFRNPVKVGNFARSYLPPRTKWFSKVEYGEVWIPADVDQALERLYERIVTEFVVSWYKDISEDQEFVEELRIVLRDVTSEILLRLSKTDLTELVINDVVPLSLQHVDSFLWTRHHSTLKDKDFHSTFVGFIGKDVQIALASRETEVEYLEDLAGRILPFILKRRCYSSHLASSLTVALLSKTVFLSLLDSLCHPRNINKLLLLWFSPAPDKEFPSSTEPPVKLLFRFVHARHQITTSSLQVDLSQILGNQDVLYPFLQFLKRHGGLNLINFCLSVEEFNKKMMVPGLSAPDLASLHSEARLLYNTYIRRGASHFIKFQPEIIKEIGEIVDGDFREVERLRTTPPLFRAYEQVYNNLGDNFCPYFHLSQEYLVLTLGPRLTPTKLSLAHKNSGARREHGAAWNGKLTRMKQGVLATTLDGSPDRPADPAYDIASTVEESSPELSHDVETRDLNAWRVTIPRLEAKSEGGKSCFVFIIQVQRIDMTSAKDGQDLQWKVARQYHEFYTLQSALVQYHGVFHDAKLPTRSKLFRGKGLDVLQSKIEPFQEFLVKLLQNPSLKKSDLLFTFLTSSNEFEEAASQLGLSRMIKSVPIKLTKERGQALPGFIETYVNGCLPSSVSPVVTCEEEPDQLDTTKSIYKDNLAHLFPFTPEKLGPSQTHSVDGIYETLLYLSVRVFSCRDSFVRLLYSLKCVLEKTVNHLIHYFIATKLDNLLTSGRVTQIIDIIEESLFSPAGEELLEEEGRFQAEKSLQAFRSYLPAAAIRAVATPPDQYEQGTLAIHQVLQDPLLNKQLAYSLLEVLIARLFPELKST